MVVKKLSDVSQRLSSLPQLAHSADDPLFGITFDQLSKQILPVPIWGLALGAILFQPNGIAFQGYSLSRKYYQRVTMLI